MKSLLTSLKTRIATQVTALGGTKAVHHMPAEDALPETTSWPCVGLKDGPVRNQYLVGASHHYFPVDIVVYVLIHTYDGIIIGKGSDKGVLDLMEDVKTALVRYTPDGYQTIHDEVPETESSYMQYGEDQLVQKKKITLKWFKTVTE